MRKIYFYLLVICLTSCVHVEKDKSSNEKFEKRDNQIQNNNRISDVVMKKEKTDIRKKYKEEDGWLKESLREDNWCEVLTDSYEFYYAPSDYFYCKDLRFHDNGILSSYTKYIFKYIIIGISKDYDKEGWLIEEKNWDNSYANFKIKPENLVFFLEKEGWYNRETGETFTLMEKDKSGEFTYSLFDRITGDLIENKDTLEDPIWNIEIHMEPGFYVPNSIIDKYGIKDKAGNIKFKCLDNSEFSEFSGNGNFYYRINAYTGEVEFSWENNYKLE